MITQRKALIYEFSIFTTDVRKEDVSFYPIDTCIRVQYFENEKEIICSVNIHEPLLCTTRKVCCKYLQKNASDFKLTTLHLSKLGIIKPMGFDF